MDILKEDLSDIKTEVTPESSSENEKSAEVPIDVVHIKDYGSDTGRQASAVIFPPVAAFAITALLLTAEPTEAFLSEHLGASAAKYALRFTPIAATLEAVFREAIALSDPSMIFFGLMLLTPLSVIYRPAASSLLFLRTLALSLGTGIVLISESALFGKCAVTTLFAVEAVTSVSAAYSALSTGDVISQKSKASQKHPFLRHTLRLIFAHGANVFIRFVLLAVGTFIL